MPTKKTVTLQAQFTKFIAAYQARMEETAKRSIQDVIIQAQKLGTKGGNMPLDTGFLRASGQISFSGMPSGPTRPTGKKPLPNSVADTTDVTILKIAEFTAGGPPLFFGWIAHYAKYQEARRGFLAAAVQMWPDFVKRNCDAVKKEIQS